LLALPGGGSNLPTPGFAGFSPDGTQIITAGRDGQTVVTYDSWPVNRAFIKR
jgi:hypothetical protein